MAKRRMSDEEFARQYAEATARGEVAMKTEPRARAARYDPESDRLVVELTNGVVFLIPRGLVQGLRGAVPEEVAEVELGPRGAALHWERLDQDFSVAGLLRGIFGTRAWMAAELGRAGGAAQSEAKVAASRANGARGGRPHTKKRAS